MVTIIVSFMAAICGLAVVCRIAVALASYSVMLALAFVGCFIALYVVVVQGYVSNYVYGLPLPW